MSMILYDLFRTTPESDLDTQSGAEPALGLGVLEPPGQKKTMEPPLLLRRKMRKKERKKKGKKKIYPSFN